MSRFIVIEGTEGVGKSTLISGLSAALSEQGETVLVTKEPGGSTLGKEIRKILLSEQKEAIAPKAELLLFLADRAQHVEKVIKPALAAGQIVLCDRYTYSTLAYQGYGRGLSRETLNQFNSFATSDLKADRVLLLDADPRVGLARAAERKNAAKLEEQLKFHDTLREGFLAMAKQEANLFRIIDCTQSPEAVLKSALDHSLSVGRE
ncbi:UNVERIFIED_CONTAM: hypothetical protein GTU68_015352 [Idotea baltica]|nr:hypothetical protein [Idotea baltica]